MLKQVCIRLLGIAVVVYLGIRPISFAGITRDEVEVLINTNMNYFWSYEKRFDCKTDVRIALVVTFVEPLCKDPSKLEKTILQQNPKCKVKIQCPQEILDKIGNK